MALADYQNLADKYANKYGLPPAIVRSVIQQESSWNPSAVGTSGEKGLMQLMPGTAKMLGVTNSFDPEQNIEAGTRYLKGHYDKYGNYRDALARYNAGGNLTAGYGYAEKVLERAGVADSAQSAIETSAPLLPQDSNSGDVSTIDSILGFPADVARKAGLWIFAFLLIIFGTWRLINE